MPNADQTAELFERMRLVETAINSHVAECRIRNENRDRRDEETHQQLRSLAKGMHSLNMSRAKMVGYIAGAAAGGSILGTAALEAAMKLLK